MKLKEKLVELGVNQTFGARPLRRVIQEQLEDKIADYILENGQVGKLTAELDADQFVITKDNLRKGTAESQRFLFPYTPLILLD